MGSLNGVRITKGSVGANAIAPSTSTSALIGNAVAVSGKFVLNTPYSVTSLKQAETLLGITEAYDEDNFLVFHRHIKDFYSDKRNANVTLYILGYELGYTLVDVLEDEGSNFAKKVIIAGEGKIKQLAVALNYDIQDETETLVDGLNNLVRAAIGSAQALYDWAASSDRACNILLEGRRISNNLNTLIDLRNIPVGDAILDANKVSIVIGQDYDYATTRYGDSIFCRYYAGVGKALGTVAAAAVNQSIAEVDEVTGGFNLSNATLGTWVTGGLSNYKKVNNVDEYLVDLNTKGYIFPITHVGVSGLRWNGDHTCTQIIVDEDNNINEHTIYYGRTMDLACSRLKIYLSKWVKKRVNVDSKSGKLPTAVVKQLEASSNNGVFAKMVNEGLISGGNTIINGDSNVQPPISLLSAEFDIVPTAIIGEVSGTVYLKKSLSV